LGSQHPPLIIGSWTIIWYQYTWQNRVNIDMRAIPLIIFFYGFYPRFNIFVWNLFKEVHHFTIILKSSMITIICPSSKNGFRLITGAMFYIFIWNEDLSQQNTSEVWCWPRWHHPCTIQKSMTIEMLKIPVYLVSG
jgi:hypothetical protein